MSSSVVPLSFSPELIETLNKAKKGDSKRVVQIEIKDEIFVNSADSGQSNVSKFNDVANIVPENEPCYILYKANPSQNKWVTVIWMPDGAKVRDRMIYASATDTIKKEFGYEYFLDDVQASIKEDFDDSALQDKINPASNEDVMSEAEKMLAEVKKEEEETRLEQQKLYDQRKGSKSITAMLVESNEARHDSGNARTSEKDEEEKDEKDEKGENDEKDELSPKVVVSPPKEPEAIKVKSTPAAITKATSMSSVSPSKSPTAAAASKLSTPSKSTSTTTSTPIKINTTSTTTTSSSSNSTAHKPVSAGKLPSSPFGSPTAAKGGGGLYQEMALPLDDKANSEVQRWKKGEVNWIELAIEKDKKDKIEFVSSKNIESRNLSSAVNASEARYYLFSYSVSSKKVNIFIYCCPDSSQRQLRMVYATSKNSVPAAASKLGINIEKKLEITTPSELTEDYIKSELSPKSSDTGRSSPSPHTKNVIKDSHPVYGLMTGGGSGGPAKKKIVMPPSGAYC